MSDTPATSLSEVKSVEANMPKKHKATPTPDLWKLLLVREDLIQALERCPLEGKDQEHAHLVDPWQY